MPKLIEYNKVRKEPNWCNLKILNITKPGMTDKYIKPRTGIKMGISMPMVCKYVMSQMKD